VSTAATSNDVTALPLAPIVITVALRLSQPSWSDAEGWVNSKTDFGSHSTTAYVVP
jgi:hypothetical protein